MEQRNPRGQRTTISKPISAHGTSGGDQNLECLGHEYLGTEDGQMLQRSRKRLVKRAKKGFRGYPVATVALYGPDDTTATKLTVGIVPAKNSEVTDLRRWFSEGSDIRNDVGATGQVLEFIADAGAKSVVMTDRIIGCPHEEGIDYEGATCPHCPFWAGRDRWTGNRLQ
jgi:hypothetical protein